MPSFADKSMATSGSSAHLGKGRRPVALIVLLAFLLGLFSWGERTAYAQSGKNSPATEPEKVLTEPPKGIGAQEVPREDGGKDKVYFSIITPEEEDKVKQEEKEREERSWEVLKNTIIDHRRR